MKTPENFKIRHLNLNNETIPFSLTCNWTVYELKIISQKTKEKKFLNLPEKNQYLYTYSNDKMIFKYCFLYLITKDKWPLVGKQIYFSKQFIIG